MWQRYQEARERFYAHIGEWLLGLIILPPLAYGAVRIFLPLLKWAAGGWLFVPFLALVLLEAAAFSVASRVRRWRERHHQARQV